MQPRQLIILFHSRIYLANLIREMVSPWFCASINAYCICFITHVEKIDIGVSFYAKDAKGGVP
jgi:hypothetical protein